MLRIPARDYWPETVRRPYLRLLAAFIGAPLIPLVIFTAMISLAADFTQTPGAGTLNATIEFAADATVGAYMMLWTFGIAVFAALWALRLRSKRAYLAAGMLVGAGAVLINAWALEMQVGATLIVFSLFSAAMFLNLRWIAGIRNL